MPVGSTTAMEPKCVASITPPRVNKDGLEHGDHSSSDGALAPRSWRAL
ncbi:hypothetical protein [Candidatus Villigracilis saccharophilus]|nr:hypothetical protein [Anaerolineales bacterium]